MGVFKKGDNWYMDYRIQGRRIRKKIGSNKKLAENVLHKKKTEIAENRFLDVRKNEKIRFKDFAEQFLNLHSKPNKKSWKDDYYNLRRISKFFKDRYIYSITMQDIEEYKAKRAEMEMVMEMETVPVIKIARMVKNAITMVNA
jgi:hypothetical protein